MSFTIGGDVPLLVGMNTKFWLAFYHLDDISKIHTIDSVRDHLYNKTWTDDQQTRRTETGDKISIFLNLVMKILQKLGDRRIYKGGFINHRCRSVIS